MRFTIPRITICLPSYGRPVRTKRILECLQAQTMNGIELLFWGDACSVFQGIIRTEWFATWKNEFQRKGNHLFYMNNAIGGRDYGAKIINAGRRIARAPYFTIVNNDDKVLPEYAQFYYESIVRSGCDFVYNTTYVWNAGHPWHRNPEIKQGSIGHNELIIRTELLRKMPPETSSYDQDWLLVQNMVAAGARHASGNAAFPTYHVMSTPGQIEPGMEADN